MRLYACIMTHCGIYQVGVCSIVNVPVSVSCYVSFINLLNVNMYNNAICISIILLITIKPQKPFFLLMYGNKTTEFNRGRIKTSSSKQILNLRIDRNLVCEIKKTLCLFNPI